MGLLILLIGGVALGSTLCMWIGGVLFGVEVFAWLIRRFAV